LSSRRIFLNWACRNGERRQNIPTKTETERIGMYIYQKIKRRYNKLASHPSSNIQKGYDYNDKVNILCDPDWLGQVLPGCNLPIDTSKLPIYAYLL